MPITWSFISEHEGGSLLVGYVPMANTSKSGATIATGIDIGQRATTDIDRWKISEDLKDRLKPYCHITGPAAKALLQTRPLTVTREEAQAIDAAAAQPIFTAVENAYNKAAGLDMFQFLPDGIQTAIASVAYQYGANLQKATPKFWRKATMQDWDGCIFELENFGDRYPRRRKAEAALIRAALAPSKITS